MKYFNITDAAYIIGRSTQYFYYRFKKIKSTSTKLIRRSNHDSKHYVCGERLKTRTGVKTLVMGKSGCGKSSLLKTINKPTLCIDMESGLLSVQDWTGDVIPIRTWREIRDLACLIGGPNPAVRSDRPYGEKHYEYVCKKFGDLSKLDIINAFLSTHSPWLQGSV